MYKDKEKLKFHVFTDEKDDWFKTKNECNEWIKSYKKEGYADFRIWTCEWNKEEGIYDDVDCIYSKGTFPI